MAWSNGALQLAALFAASAALQQAAAVKVATADEFVAALKGGDESIEVTNHLYLNNGSALELAAEVSSTPAGYLLSLDGDVSIKITGECTDPPPLDMSDGLPANLVSSNDWPYAKLPPLQPNQCVLRIASGFAQIYNGGVLHLENLVISAPYLFERNEAVGPTAADTPPATPPRGDDYVDEFEGAPGPYAFDYDNFFGPVAGPLSYYGDYGAPGPSNFDYATFPATAPAPDGSFFDYSDIAPAPGPGYDSDYVAPPRPYEGREAYPDYEDSNEFFSDPVRSTVLYEALIGMDAVNYFDGVAPAPAPLALGGIPVTPPSAPDTPEAPQPTQLFLTNVVLAGGATHMRATGSSLYAEGTSFIDCEYNSMYLSTESTANFVDCTISNNGNSFSSGGVSLSAASVMRAENVTFANNGARGGDLVGERYGVSLFGAKTRLYTDSLVNVEEEFSQGDVLPLEDAPAGPFLTKQ